MLTFFFKELDHQQVDFLSGQVGEGKSGLIYDLLCDSSGWYALVEEGKSVDFNDFLDKIGVDLK